MNDWLDNLRAKPEKERKQIALLSSLGIAIFIGVLWFGANALTGSTSQTASAGQAVDSPFSVLTKEAKGVITDIKTGAKTIIDSVDKGGNDIGQ